jgi:hypothetical protein
MRCSNFELISNSKIMADIKLIFLLFVAGVALEAGELAIFNFYFFLMDFFS